MTKTTKQLKQRVTKSTTPQHKKNHTKETSTVSIRMSKDERALLKQAANLESITQAQFLKKAAVTHAVQAINTQTETTFDFREIARHTARLLFQEFQRGLKFRQAVFSPIEDIDQGGDTNASGGRALCHADFSNEYEGWQMSKDFSPYADVPEKWSDFYDEDGSLVDNAPYLKDTKRKESEVELFKEIRRANRLGGNYFWDMVLSDGSDLFGSAPKKEPIDPQAID